MKRLVIGVAIGLLVATLGAQQLYVGTTDDPSKVHWAEKTDFDGSILFCRGYYNSTRQEANGAGWFTDFPGADNNFLVRLSELTLAHVKFDEKRVPIHVTVRLDDREMLPKCPILYMEDVGTLSFNSDAVTNLQHYFAQGGFLWVDDFWGDLAWDQWEYEIRRVLPSADYPMIDIPNDHAILHQLYDIKDGIWQQSTVGIWSEPGHPTSERGAESATPHFRGILDDHGRIIVAMTHNTDIADGWEEAEWGEYNAYANEFSARSYALGVNIWLYAMTH